ncbi:hypothetical protein [Ancylobacter lacus]|uniref:hypothetical protein n=1 Tax=Ancylobacter lacus TaxID=2579970 RepID=UPI001BD08C0A|nr:hypothetical protein [Ancylobacter lacus]MBS7540646.1 hypothetical protein [Ancylobacter lacus]
MLRREPHFPPETIDAALDLGLRGGRDARDGRSPLYSMAIDGFSHENPPQPGITIPWGQFSTVELFSDGYPGQPSGATIADWEALIDAANREDPRRLGRFAAVKGVIPGGSHDDRSLIIVRHWARPRI